jgi:hypothetical protein
MLLKRRPFSEARMRITGRGAKGVAECMRSSRERRENMAMRQELWEKPINVRTYDHAYEKGKVVECGLRKKKR